MVFDIYVIGYQELCVYVIGGLSFHVYVTELQLLLRVDSKVETRRLTPKSNTEYIVKSVITTKCQ